ncbi:histone-lysine N-methyltransferase SETMAR [Trichonephila clavipes]|nr:histone-lysine N-methyltransferase SETMAR [Trichonephila clavipes]
MVQIEHPPCLPDVNPTDFLFLRLALSLKGKRFDDTPDIQRNVTRLLNFISKENLRSFQDMYSRSQRNILMGGDYFEGQNHVGLFNCVQLPFPAVPLLQSLEHQVLLPTSLLNCRYIVEATLFTLSYLFIKNGGSFLLRTHCSNEIVNFETALFLQFQWKLSRNIVNLAKLVSFLVTIRMLLEITGEIEKINIYDESDFFERAVEGGGGGGDP